MTGSESSFRYLPLILSILQIRCQSKLFGKENKRDDAR